MAYQQNAFNWLRNTLQETVYLSIRITKTHFKFSSQYCKICLSQKHVIRSISIYPVFSRALDLSAKLVHV